MSDDKREREGAEPDDLVRLLDEAAAVEAAERRESDAVTNAPGARDVERILREQWDRAPAKRARWTRPRILGACVAAAVVIVCVVIWSRAPEDDRPSGQYLGDDRFEVTSPTGVVREWPKTIHWNADPLAREYAVDILDDESGRVLVDLGRTIATEIEFPTQESVAWPSLIEIRVKAWRKDGTQGSTSKRVELVK
ncbi:MAG: hypothetical protein ACKVWV_16340 [Planctomycetota bacterium]